MSNKYPAEQDVNPCSDGPDARSPIRNNENPPDNNFGANVPPLAIYELIREQTRELCAMALSLRQFCETMAKFIDETTGDGK